MVKVRSIKQKVIAMTLKNPYLDVRGLTRKEAYTKILICIESNIVNSWRIPKYRPKQILNAIAHADLGKEQKKLLNELVNANLLRQKRKGTNKVKHSAEKAGHNANQAKRNVTKTLHVAVEKQVREKISDGKGGNVTFVFDAQYQSLFNEMKDDRDFLDAICTKKELAVRIFKKAIPFPNAYSICESSQATKRQQQRKVEKKSEYNPYVKIIYTPMGNKR